MSPLISRKSNLHKQNKISISRCPGVQALVYNCTLFTGLLGHETISLFPEISMGSSIIFLPCKTLTIFLPGNKCWCLKFIYVYDKARVPMHDLNEHIKCIPRDKIAPLCVSAHQQCRKFLS